MNKYLILLVFLFANQTANANEWVSSYYPVGTQWTEIRYDTQMHDGWFTWDGSSWSPNYEIVRYYVMDGFLYKIYDNRDPMPVRLVYCQREEMPDSLCLGVMEEEWDQSGTISVNVSYPDVELKSIWFKPCLAYTFNEALGIGDAIYYMPVSSLFTTGRQSSYGKVIAIGEDYFGGSIPLKYADVESGKYVDERTGNKAVFRIIEGIGITSWRSDECIFGANKVYHIFEENGYPPQSHDNFRSMLVHFERDGEVLYDVWPTPEGTNSLSQQPTPSPSLGRGEVYDLQGRRLNEDCLPKGFYIMNGKKIINK